MRQNQFLPCRRAKGMLEIAAADPFHFVLADTLSLLTGLPVVLTYAPSARLTTRFQDLFPDNVTTDSPEKTTRAAGPASPLPEPAAGAEEIVDSSSAVELVSSIIDGGVRHGATDVHLEPYNEALRVRYRIDGRLRRVMDVPSQMIPSVISRMKVLSNLNVTERRRPQDGHFSLNINQGAFDFRVSTLPTHIGEKIVIRILDESRVMHDLEGLGMEPFQSTMVKKWIARPHGLLLVTGPTGSGKSSTLYAALNTINDESKNIVTIEDPVEYRLDGINQVQVDSGSDLTFAGGLRSILRQDPDVIMVGEVRDRETARIAMRASLTGHLVFSTLHTNTAAGVIATLGQMGIEDYMVVSAVSGIISQRLVRQLCTECRARFKPTAEMLRNLGMEPGSNKRLYKPAGCGACLKSGYHGRTGVYELMPMLPEIGEAILAGRSEAELTAIAREQGLGSMMQNASLKLSKGITSPQELLEVLTTDE
jgi:type II secretory ATPase GspE/PulE/Tfp pilus assembly ATPase PilB-like protein